MSVNARIKYNGTTETYPLEKLVTVAQLKSELAEKYSVGSPANIRLVYMGMVIADEDPVFLDESETDDDLIYMIVGEGSAPDMMDYDPDTQNPPMTEILKGKGYADEKIEEALDFAQGDIALASAYIDNVGYSIAYLIGWFH